MRPVHIVTIDEKAYRALLSGDQTCEILRLDPHIRVGDVVVFRYQASLLAFIISHILVRPDYGLAEGWGILSLHPLDAGGIESVVRLFPHVNCQWLSPSVRCTCGKKKLLRRLKRW